MFRRTKKVREKLVKLLWTSTDLEVQQDCLKILQELVPKKFVFCNNLEPNTHTVFWVLRNHQYREFDTSYSVIPRVK